MQLRTAHIALILSAIALGVLIMALGVRRYVTDGDVAGLMFSAAGGLAGGAFAFYLRHFLRKGRPAQPRQ